jgi:predicted enzyme related to lactoylglutathione lyase
VSQNIKLIVFPVKDMDGAKALYSKFLGVAPYADSPYYVGYKQGDLEVGLTPSAESIVCYIDVADIKHSLQELLAAGGALQQDITDVGGGLLIAQVKDASSNVLGLRQMPT